MEKWSNSDEGSPDHAAIPEKPHTPAKSQLLDGYESGDLGDVSCAYATERPERDSPDTDSPPSDSNDLETDLRQSEATKGHGQGNGRGQSGGRGQQDKISGKTSLTCELVNPDSGGMMEVTVSLPSEELVRNILGEMWRYAHAYHISNSVSTCNGYK